MKKFIAVLCMAMLAVSVAEARPHGGPHGFGRPHGHHSFVVPHHHHHHNATAGFFAGLIGGTILNAAFAPRVTTTYSPVTYAAPAVVATPAVAVAPVAVPAPVVTTTQPCYTTTNIVTGATTTSCSSTIISSPIY